MHGEDKPFFADAGIYRIPGDSGIDPVKPWKLELVVENNSDGDDMNFYVDYKLNQKYIIQPDGLDEIASTDAPIWHTAWQSQKINLGLLFFSLIILCLALWKMDILVKYNRFWKIFRLVGLVCWRTGYNIKHINLDYGPCFTTFLGCIVIRSNTSFPNGFCSCFFYFMG